jgi:hypothetical protein
MTEYDVFHPLIQSLWNGVKVMSHTSLVSGGRGMGEQKKAAGATGGEDTEKMSFSDFLGGYASFW